MSDNTKVKSRKKVETVAEYLARGGSIQFVPAASKEKQPDVTRKTTNGGPAVFLTLEEADLFFGETKKLKTKKAKSSFKLDLSALPPALREKMLAKLREETDGEGYEEELEETEDESTSGGGSARKG